MFEFTAKIVNRGGFRFEAKEVNGKFIYETSDTKEIEALKEAGFSEVKKEAPKAKKKKES